MKNEIASSFKNLFLLIVAIFSGCGQSPLTEDSIHLKFPLYIDIQNIPSGWTLNDHFGYVLHNPNVKRIFINDLILEGNFDIMVATNEPLKTSKGEYDFKGVSININPLIAADILDKLLNQNIPLYEISKNNVIAWIDLKNSVKYFYSPEDSVFLISYLIPYSSDPHNRKNRLR